MSIKDEVYRLLLTAAEERLIKLREYDAPEVILDNQTKRVESIKAMDFDVFKKHPEWLSLEIDNSILKKGKGGKPFYQFTTKGGPTINYFPNGRFGPFLGLQTR